MIQKPPKKQILIIDFTIADQPKAEQLLEPTNKTESTAEISRPIPTKHKVFQPAVKKHLHKTQQVTGTESQVTPVSEPSPALESSAEVKGNSDVGAPAASPSTGGTITEKPETKYVKTHFKAIRNAIVSKLSYPHVARRQGWSGTVKVSFIINEDGGVSDVRVVETSGFEVLDNCAVDTIRGGSPYPKPPCKAEIVMPITFRLED